MYMIRPLSAKPDEKRIRLLIKFKIIEFFDKFQKIEIKVLKPDKTVLKIKSL